MDLFSDLDPTFWLDGRLKTYKNWPFKSTTKSCNPRAMAEAGFVSVGGEDEPDHVECFICKKQLDGWEPSDDPWEEHKKHQPNCPYILLNKRDEMSWTIEETYGLIKEFYLAEIERRRSKIMAAAKKEIDEQGSLIPKIFMNAKNIKKS